MVAAAVDVVSLSLLPGVLVHIHVNIDDSKKFVRMKKNLKQLKISCCDG